MFNDVIYKSFKNELPPGWSESTTPSFGIVIPIARDFLTTDNLKVLLVLEHVATADLRCNKLLGSKTSKIAMINVLTEAQRAAEETMDVSLAAINFNYFKTYHLDDAQYNTAQGFAARRVIAFIQRVKPDVVLVFGDGAAEALLPDVENVAEKRGWVHELTVGTYVTKVVTTIRIETDLFEGPYSNDDATSEESGSKIADRANLLGYISRCVSNGFAGRLIYDASSVKVNAKFVDTIPKFNRLFSWLKERQIIAVDTETENLNVHNNKIVTIQFAFDSATSYILPYRHKNTPFSGPELSYIRAKLRAFFGQKVASYAGKDTRYLIGHGFKFDLRIIRQEFGIPHIYWPVWDTIAGEFCLDENLKTLKAYGTSSWGLQSLFARYGNDFYLTAEFSKGDRAQLSKVGLTQDVLDYAGMDVQSIFKIHELQRARASKMWLGSKSYGSYYHRFVLTQMSNINHVMSTMEQRGVLLDRKQLLHLMESDSEINSLLTELEDKLKTFPSVIEANKRLLKTEGIPDKGLFGSVDMWVFNLGKPYHKYVLFIDVLGLAPVFYGKSITPDGEYMAKIDKVFQKEYSHIPEVALLTELQKAKKIKSSYVNAFYNRLCSDEDTKVEGRIRPGYGYQDVLTGRSNSFSPSLQQIPQHSAVAKLIKRLFIAPQGKLVLHMDYSIHEVRCWGIVSKDTEVGKSFQIGKNCRIRYRLNPTQENLDRVKMLGDPHKTNYSSFTGVPVKDITAEMRQESKGITFGCFTADTIVSTDQGPTYLGTLAHSKAKARVITVGREVLQSGGVKSKGIKPIVRVLTTHANLKGTSGHEVLRITADCKLAMIPLGELKVGDFLVYQRGRGGNVQPILSGQTLSLLDAEAMGLFTADGIGAYYNNDNSGNYRLHHGSIDKMEVSKVQAFFYKYGGVEPPISKGLANSFNSRVAKNGPATMYGCQINNKKLFLLLQEFGLLGNQHVRRVPEQILRAPKKYVSAYLRGYFEGDGGFRASSGGQISATTVNADLATDIVYLLNLIGIDSKLYCSRSSTPTNLVYEVVIGRKESILLFLRTIGFITKKKISLGLAYAKQTKNRPEKALRIDSPIDYRSLRALYRERAGVTTFRARNVYYRGIHVPPIPRHLHDLIKSVTKYKEAFQVLGMQDEWKTLHCLSLRGTKGSIVLRSAEPQGDAEVFDVINVVKEHSWSANGIVVSNSIYGMSIPSLAASIHQSKEYAQKVYDSFFAKFKKAAGWLDWAMSFSKKNLYVYSPLGRRRNLSGYMSGTKYLEASLGRRAKNCLTGEHLVDTSIGMLCLRDLVGREPFKVCTADGKYMPCLGAESRGVKSVVKVILNDGTVLRGTADHKIRILGENLDYAWKALGDLRKSDYVVKVSGSSRLSSKLYVDHISNTRHTFIPVLHEAVPGGEEEVFDIIEVRGQHHFIANGVVVSNSPIQGMASDFGFMAARLISEKVYEFQRQTGLIDVRVKDYPVLDTGVNVMVHDSIEVEVPYDLICPVLHIMEWCATVGVQEYVKSIFNMDFIVGLEVDFEIGATGDKLRKWDFTDKALREVLTAALVDKRDILGDKIDVDVTLRKILASRKKYASFVEQMQLDLEEINE